jgi:hypothetical protein
MIRYELIVEESREALLNEVNSALNIGGELYGNPFGLVTPDSLDGSCIAQAIIFRDEEEV